MQCLIELYKCQDEGRTNCQQAKGCVLIEPVVTEGSEADFENTSPGEGSGSYLPPSGGSVGIGSRPEFGSSSSSQGAENTHERPSGIGQVPSTTNNPAHGGAGGQHRKSF